MMTIDINEFHHEFFQDILSDAEASERLSADAFFEKFCDHLVEAGEIETADHTPYLTRRQDIRVDGYGGDPRDNINQLTLIISEFSQDQDPKPVTLTKMDMETAFRKLRRFLEKALDPKWRKAIEHTSHAFGLADLISARWEIISKVRFFLITNRKLSGRVDGREADEFDGRTITYHVWDIQRLHRFVAMNRSREDLIIDLKKDFERPLPVLEVEGSDEHYKSYLASIPGEMLAAIYDRWGTRLLEQNVRVFLQARGNVNKGIRNTIELEPSMFFAYNNGLTATAEDVEVSRGRSGLLLNRLVNFQIVNGGQTMASVHAARSGDLSQVSVQMKLSVVDAQFVEDMVPKISEYANTQNRVNAADFFSNHLFHRRIEEFSRRVYAPAPEGAFQESKWFYERARGQYMDARSPLTVAKRKKFEIEYPRKQLITKTDLAKFLKVWDMEPHTVSLGAQKNFAKFASEIGAHWEKRQNDFNQAWYREMIAKAIVFKETERLVSIQTWYRGGYRANIVAYAIAKMAHDVAQTARSVNFERIWRQQSITDAMSAALVLVARAVDGTLTDPPPKVRNVTEWAKQQACWSRVAELDIKWPDPFLDELISLEEHAQPHEEGKKIEIMDKGIRAQTKVFNAGGTFWGNVLEWGREKKHLNPKSIGIFGVAARIPEKTPTEKQAEAVLMILQHLQSEGCPHQLPE